MSPDLASGLAGAELVHGRYKPKGLVWRIAENFECEPGVIAAAEVVKSGKIGKVAFFKYSCVTYIRQDNKYYKTSWRAAPDVRNYNCW